MTARFDLWPRESSIGAMQMAGNVIVKTFHRVLHYLESLGVPCAVVRGPASAAWERVRSIQDEDLLIVMQPDEFTSLVDLFAHKQFLSNPTSAVQSCGDVQLAQLHQQPEDDLLENLVDLLMEWNEVWPVALPGGSHWETRHT